MNIYIKIILIFCALLTVVGAVSYYLSESVSSEYSFDATTKIWTNANKNQIDIRALTCNYSKISDISNMVTTGSYKETISLKPLQSVVISVSGGATKLYQVSIEKNSDAIMKEIK